MHKHDNLSEIIFVMEGKGDYIIDNINYSVERGDILIYNSGVLHHEQSNPEYPLETFVCGIDNLFIIGANCSNI